MSEPVHEVYAIRYAHHDRPASHNFLGASDAHDTSMPLDYFVWVITGESGTFLVDTGFDTSVAKARGRTIVNAVGEGLMALGLAPDSIENVIVTHLHYDHAGNHDLFPRARYHLQDCEMEYATGRCMCHHHLRAPFEGEDVAAMVRKVFAGRVDFHDGDSQIAPGITVHKIGGHSKGLQSVRVNTRRGPVILASDAAHLYAHLEQQKIFPIVYNIGDVLEGYRRLNALAPTAEHIIPGHDPDVTRRYPAARAGLEGWIVRLDADPVG